jgi:predicted phage-related endonuclease
MRTPRPLRMKIERHPTAPGQLHPLRASDVTASVAAALVGLHPYQTAMGLFAEKTGVEMPSIDDSTAMRRGRLLEDAVARAFLEDHAGWKVTKANVYLRAPLLRFGASPDFFVIDDNGRKGVLQAKTVAPHVYKRIWTDQTPPTYIVLQCLIEMMLARVDLGIVAALIVDGYRFELRTYNIPRHPAAERRLQDAVAQFWSDIAAGRTPNVDYARDASLLPVLFPHHVERKIVDLRGDNHLPELLDELEVVKAEIKDKIARKDAIETEMKFKMGDAEAALVTGWRITNRDQHRKEHTVKASDFRQLRIARDKLAETTAA